jgi:hypothetical protein
MSNSPFLVAVCLALTIVVVSLALAPPIHHQNPPGENGAQQTQENKNKADTYKPILPSVNIQCEPNCTTQETEEQRYPSYAAWLLHKSINDPITGFNGLLVIVTTLLFVVAWIQIRDARVLQRAYLSVDSAGVEPLASGGISDSTSVAHVVIKNVGNLPARDVKWFISAKFSTNGRLDDFPIDRSVIYGNNVVPPGTEMKRSQNFKATYAETSALQAEKTHLYVWGEIFYSDGFGIKRFTKFCHRYSRGVVVSMPHYFIRADSMRYHQYGNDAD